MTENHTGYYERGDDTPMGEVERLREALQAQEDAEDARDECECEGEGQWEHCGPCSVRFGRAICLRQAALAANAPGAKQ